VAGGAGSAVLEFLQRIGSTIPVLQIGVPDRFIEHGSREDNLIAAGLDGAAIRAVIDRFWRRPEIPRAVPVS
jgi:1-deoxy-D-xylulose-5-phosphate synthase